MDDLFAPPTRTEVLAVSALGVAVALATFLL
jgi:hypothetical protein